MPKTEPNWIKYATHDELEKYANLEGIAVSANAQRERIRRLCMVRARKAKASQ